MSEETVNQGTQEPEESGGTPDGLPAGDDPSKTEPKEPEPGEKTEPKEEPKAEPKPESKTPDIPDSPEGYGIEAMIPKGLEIRSDLIKATQEIAHKHGAPPEMIKELVGAFVQDQEALDEASHQANRAYFRGLQGRWGDKTQQNIQTAVAAMQNLDGGRFAQVLQDSGAYRIPWVIDLFYVVAEMINERPGGDNPGSRPAPKSLAKSMYPGMK